MSFQQIDEAEAAAERAWAWLKQIQADRALQISVLSTAVILSGEIGQGSCTVNIGHLRGEVANVGSDFDRDVRALIEAGHLSWRPGSDGLADAAMRLFRFAGQEDAP